MFDNHAVSGLARLGGLRIADQGAESSRSGGRNGDQGSESSRVFGEAAGPLGESVHPSGGGSAEYLWASLD